MCIQLHRRSSRGEMGAGYLHRRHDETEGKEVAEAAGNGVRIRHGHQRVPLPLLLSSMWNEVDGGTVCVMPEARPLAKHCKEERWEARRGGVRQRCKTLVVMALLFCFTKFKKTEYRRALGWPRGVSGHFQRTLLHFVVYKRKQLHYHTRFINEILFCMIIRIMNVKVQAMTYKTRKIVERKL